MCSHTFRPLFGKTWRIYKIFMRSQMTVVKITDLGLALRIAVVWVVDLALLTIIQLTDPVVATSRVVNALPKDQRVR